MATQAHMPLSDHRRHCTRVADTPAPYHRLVKQHVGDAPQNDNLRNVQIGQTFRPNELIIIIIITAITQPPVLFTALQIKTTTLSSPSIGEYIKTPALSNNTKNTRNPQHLALIIGCSSTGALISGVRGKARHVFERSPFPFMGM